MKISSNHCPLFFGSLHPFVSSNDIWTFSARQSQNIARYEHPIRSNVDTHDCSQIIPVIEA